MTNTHTNDINGFLDYWEAEGAAYARAGDYVWMAAQVPEAKRVLEIGCGAGFGTQALLQRGFSVLAVDALDACLTTTQARIANVGQPGEVVFLQADIAALVDAARQTLFDFQPQVVLCWLMGAPQETTGAAGKTDREASAAVAAYREKTHRQVAELAASLPEVVAVHLIDRTAIPWQAKDLGRDTLVRYHLFKTFADLPFDAVRRDALYRKLEGRVDEAGKLQSELRRAHPALKSVTPTLASLVARRRTT
ncbi:MAG: class I SAM-dependent methyltransferase [Zoogloeaceae bacterium]|jgi:SAM-dependent methyltransferase|nr:class I SAM-dependent methyltransferase [Zoogloeaceae bacterium]